MKLLPYFEGKSASITQNIFKNYGNSDWFQWDLSEKEQAFIAA